MIAQNWQMFESFSRLFAFHLAFWFYASFQFANTFVFHFEPNNRWKVFNSFRYNTEHTNNFSFTTSIEQFRNQISKTNQFLRNCVVLMLFQRLYYTNCIKTERNYIKVEECVLRKNSDILCSRIFAAFLLPLPFRLSDHFFMEA